MIWTVTKIKFFLSILEDEFPKLIEIKNKITINEKKYKFEWFFWKNHVYIFYEKAHLKKLFYCFIKSHLDI